MSWIQYILPIAVSTICSWAIAWVIVKFLFHPQKTIKILGINLQGIIPNKQSVAIKKLAHWINSSFISFNEIEERITDPGNFEQLKPEIEKHIDHFLRNKLKEAFPMISAFIGDKTINKLKEAFLKELETLFPVLIKNYIDKLKQDVDIEKIIEAKLSAVSSARLEEFFNQYAKKRVLIYSTCFGFLIANVQLIVTILFTK